jgi:hypothetical protein
VTAPAGAFAGLERLCRTVRADAKAGVSGPNGFLRGERPARAVDEFVIRYNQERNHQGLANQLIRPGATAFPVGGNICRRKRLGGLLNYYHRAAAG